MISVGWELALGGGGKNIGEKKHFCGGNFTEPNPNLARLQAKMAVWGWEIHHPGWAFPDENKSRNLAKLDG